MHYILFSLYVVFVMGSCKSSKKNNALSPSDSVSILGEWEQGIEKDQKIILAPPSRGGHFFLDFKADNSFALKGPPNCGFGTVKTGTWQNKNNTIHIALKQQTSKNNPPKTIDESLQYKIIDASLEYLRLDVSTDTLNFKSVKKICLVKAQYE